MVFELICNVVEEEKPNLLISAGDFGKEATSKMFRPILKKTKILTIYGNYDNLHLIKSLKNYDGSDCLLQDGVITKVNDIGIVGINGNVAERKSKPHHKTVEEVREVISGCTQFEDVDILVTHEVPKHPLLTKGAASFGFDVFDEAVDKLKPMLYLCGHIHRKSQIIQWNETKLINIDSSTRHSEYAICLYENGQFNGLLTKSVRWLSIRIASPLILKGLCL